MSILISCAIRSRPRPSTGGIRLEAIAALLGHRSLGMTLSYARIADGTVADEYFKVTEAVEAQYYGLSGTGPSRRAAGTSAPPVNDHRRLLANGHCTTTRSARLCLRERL